MPAEFSRTTRSLAQDSGRFAMAAWCGVAVLLAAWFAWLFLGSVTLREVARAARLEVRQAAHPLSASVAGRITASTLVIGTWVQAGDVLVELDAGGQTLRRREEEARLAGLGPQIEALKKEIAARERSRDSDRESAVAAVDAARARVSEAGAGVDFAGENERRLRIESEAGGAARIDALRASSEAQRLAAGREAMSADVRRLQSEAAARDQGSRAAIENLHRTRATLEAEAAALRGSLARLAHEIDEHRIRAPIAGRIGDVLPLRPGEFVQPGQRLASVVPDGDWLVVADFAPAALGRLRVGQVATLRLDGFPWAQYGSIDATVARVGGEIRDGLVRVELVPQGPPPGRIAVQHGLPGTLEVVVEQVAPALLALRASGQALAGAAPAAVAQAR